MRKLQAYAVSGRVAPVGPATTANHNRKYAGYAQIQMPRLQTSQGGLVLLSVCDTVPSVMHAYPTQLADFVIDNWPSDAPLALSQRDLRELLSTCFQASLAQEEGRHVRFRAVVASEAELQRCRASDRWVSLSFVDPRPFTTDEVRRLSPAAPFQTAAIGVTVGDQQARIWGTIQTGAHWLTPTWGGRPLGLEAQRFPIIQVLAPGRLVVYCGSQLIVSLERGFIEARTTDVFTSKWLPRLFSSARRQLQAEARSATPAQVEFDETLIGTISQHMIRRAIFLIRNAGHGGLLLCLETQTGMACAAGTGPLNFKYTLSEQSDRNRYQQLLAQLLLELGRESTGAPIDWAHFLAATNPRLQEIEQSIFEFSSLVAGLSAVDGAVVLDKRFALLGFGAEVAGGLPYPDPVYQALDLEAERVNAEPATAVGTRHRAAYRFVAHCPEGLAIVVSHDGAVRFVANVNQKVVYWEQFLNW